MASQLLLSQSPEPDMASGRDNLSASQSLAMVQVFFNASLACICYCRELMPHSSRCFQPRFMSDLKAWQKEDGAYSAFRDLNCLLLPGKGDVFQVLVRSENVQAEQILNLLEKGIFDAIEKGYLEAVQFFITPDTQNPSAVCESYTFSLNYGRDTTGGSSRVEGIRLSSAENSVHMDAYLSFADAIQTLVRGLRFLPCLPRTRSLGMSLVYNDACPPTYQPQGFNDATPTASEQDYPDWSVLWKEATETFDEFSTGICAIAVGTNNAEPFLRVNDITWSGEQDLLFTRQLQDMQKSSSQCSALPSTLSESKQHRQRANRSDMIDPEHVLPSTPARIHQSSQTRSSQFGQVPRSSKIPSRSKRVPVLTASLRGRRQRNIVAEKLAELVVHACAMENNNQTAHYIFDSDVLKQNQIFRLQSVENVRCECQSAQVIEDMLVCNLCGTLQHKICYGFLDMPESKLPSEHFCYGCLLLPKEESLNAKMPALVRMRLALTYMFTQRAPRIYIDSAFAKALHLDINQKIDRRLVAATLEQLEEEGYITDRSENGVKIVESKKRDAEINYLDHLASISHHYDAVKDKETTVRRYRLIQTALDTYSDGCSYLVDDPDPTYDEVAAKDAFGMTVRRWGYYTSKELESNASQDGGSKRKACSLDLPESSTSKKLRGRKLSMGPFINLDRVIPSTELSWEKAVNARRGYDVIEKDGCTSRDDGTRQSETASVG